MKLDIFKFKDGFIQTLSIATKKQCSKCGRGTLVTNPYGKPVRVCTGCKKIEKRCECESK